jgi:hypothetical protein
LLILWAKLAFVGRVCNDIMIIAWPFRYRIRFQYHPLVYLMGLSFNSVGRASCCRCIRYGCTIIAHDAVWSKLRTLFDPSTGRWSYFSVFVRSYFRMLFDHISGKCPILAGDVTLLLHKSQWIAVYVFTFDFNWSTDRSCNIS